MMKSGASEQRSAKTIRSSSKIRSRSLSSPRMKVRKFLRRCFLFTLIDNLSTLPFLHLFRSQLASEFPCVNFSGVSLVHRCNIRMFLFQLKQPTPTSPTDYTCSSTSRVASSLHTDSSSTSPDLDCGLEMKSGPVETPSIEAHLDTNGSLRGRKTHPPQTAT